MDMGMQVKEHQETLGFLQNKLQEITEAKEKVEAACNQQKSETAQTNDVNSKVNNKFSLNMYKFLSAFVRVRMSISTSFLLSSVNKGKWRNCYTIHSSPVSSPHCEQ